MDTVASCAYNGAAAMTACVRVVDACRHHQHGRWQARIGRVSGNKDLYLGTFSTHPSTPIFFNFLPSLHLSAHLLHTLYIHTCAFIIIQFYYIYAKLPFHTRSATAMHSYIIQLFASHSTACMHAWHGGAMEIDGDDGGWIVHAWIHGGWPWTMDGRTDA
jgi:hypothetical protein